jgi:hypothetical protein
VNGTGRGGPLMQASGGRYWGLTVPAPMSRLLSLVVLAAIAAPAAAQGLAVVSTSPAANAVAAPRSGPIAVTFSEPLDPASVTAARFRVMGRWSGPVAGALALSEGARTLTFTPARPFQAGEHVTVQVAGAIRDASGATLGTGRGLTFWAAAGPGSLDLPLVDEVEIRRPGEDNIVTYGGVGMDLDGDRFNDFVVSNEATNDVRVFLNDGAGGYGAFTVVPLPGGAIPSPLEAGDFNADGRMDLAVANTGNDRVSVLLGDGAGGFPGRAAYRAGQAVRAIAAFDLDGDGVDDLVTGNRSARTVTALRGAADGTFGLPVAAPVQSVEPHALAVADFDEDGRLDVVVGDFGGQALVVLRNDAAGGLAEASRVAVGGSPWMAATGDLDGDGHADVAVAGSFAGVVAVAFGDGAGGFSSVLTLPSGQFLVAIDVGDLDGDGDLDVVSSNYGSEDYRLFENLGGRQFGTPRLFPVAGAASCMTLHDRDDDGDLDMTGIDEVVDRMYLYENTGPVASEPAPAAAPTLALAGPNPARSRATVTVSLPEAGPARLTLVDALGREVAVVVDGEVPSGPHPAAFDVGGLAPGVYVARLVAGGAVASVRLTVAR